MSDKIVTSDLSKFGSRERAFVARLLTAWSEQGLPEAFANDEVVPMMNTNSGNVFLTNSEYQTAMMNGDTLESFYYCPECGHEGFKEDMQHEGSSHCRRYVRDLGLESETEGEAKVICDEY